MILINPCAFWIPRWSPCIWCALSLSCPSPLHLLRAAQASRSHARRNLGIRSRMPPPIPAHPYGSLHRDSSWATCSHLSPRARLRQSPPSPQGALPSFAPRVPGLRITAHQTVWTTITGRSPHAWFLYTGQGHLLIGGHMNKINPLSEPSQESFKLTEES